MGQFESCGHNLLGDHLNQKNIQKQLKPQSSAEVTEAQPLIKMQLFVLFKQQLSSSPSCCHTSGMRTTQNVRCPLTTNTCRV